ncbi:MAG: DEAD/DEAH box helicase [Nitrospirota bacterium]|nr:DEAD/DEAH box helicase [Nitrospirota bacterium]
MTYDELSSQLHDFPVRLLHRLAQGRIHRHFRMGKTRLVHVLLSLPPEQLETISAEVVSIIRFQETVPAVPKPTLQPPTQSKVSKPTAKEVASKEPTAPLPPPITTSEFLEGIGVPDTPQSFSPDTWQQEAIDSLKTGDVIVSVPTGSGKTFVAVEAARQAMAADQTVIYTSPLKALSNTKMTEFSQIFGADQVGILTGDRRDNPHAPILIMTTEILRNLLYDAAGGEIDMRMDTLGLVILDESQYLADPERGVVWEETIIFCPAQSRLLLLSASIGNPEEIAAWISHIRLTECHLVHHRNRSVPLRAAYLDPSGQFTPLFRNRDIVLGQKTTLHPDTQHLFTQYEEHTLGHRHRR